MSRRLSSSLSSRSSSRGAQPAERRGIVLLIVMAMLALFATVGLSFVFYSDAQFIASYYHRQSLTLDLSDVPPEKLLNAFLSAQIYGNDDPQNALRGHDFGTNMYGYPGGTVAFSGIGAFLTDAADTFGKDSMGNSLTVDQKRKFVNLQQFSGDPLRQPQEGLNAPYTFYDRNSLFLAAINASGELEARSYDPGSMNLDDKSDVYARYYTVRPHRVVHDKFVSPLITGDGDVRNLEGAKGKKSGSNYLINDSFWIDIGFPIMTTKDGTRFKPLFAPLILDLDNRVNLSVAGNYLGSATANSMHGLGAHEINPAVSGFMTASELPNLWTGSGRATGRYGSGSSPKNATGVTLPKTQVYSRLDFSAKSTTKMKLPQANSFLIYPTFDDPAAPQSDEWSDVNAANPSATPPFPGNPSQFGYDALKRPRGDGTTNDDSPFAPSNMEAWLRWGEKGTPALTSDPMRLMPDSFNMTTAGSKGQKNRHLVTVLSNSLDVPHLAPFFTGATTKYELSPGDTFPRTSVTNRQQTLPTLPTAPATYTGGGEFSPSFNSRLAYLQRINLQRNLTAYSTNAAQALTDRQEFAKDIYTRLLKVTGAKEDVSDKATTDPEYKAAKWLAQLAVNIVDYIDEDDKLTVFNWNTQQSGGTKDYVIGFEQPRLLINEVYAAYDNDSTDIDPNDPDPKFFRLNVYVELVNPMDTDTLIRDTNAARYRLALAEKSPDPDDDIYGTPKNLYKQANGGDCLVTDWDISTGNAKALKAKDMKKETGLSPGNPNGWFYLLSPTNTNYLGGSDPTFTGVTFNTKTPALSSKMSLVAGEPDLTKKPNLILQRLADPDRAQSDDLTKPDLFNPYVTIDYFKSDYISVNMGLQHKGKMLGKGVQKKIDFNTFSSRGRKEPMRASSSSVQTASGGGNEPRHSFAEHNNGRAATEPFIWLPHLDRPLASLPEILQVVTIDPREVTQKFPFGGCDNLFYKALKDNDTLLWRFMETVSVPDKTLRSTLNAGQISIVSAGKINVLTAQDQLIFDALADHRSSVSTFAAADPGTLYNNIKNLRPIAGYSNFKVKNAGASNVVELQDSPISTLVSGTPSDASDLFQQSELARKITNNITFTSNVFAVWVTVGFFEVDSNGLLGAEIGKSENRHVRHRMFAIVDRSQMVAPDKAYYKVKAAASAGNGATVQFEINDTSASTSVKATSNWTIKKGMRLVMGSGGAEERIEVLTVDTATPPTYFTANLTKNHPVGETIKLDGYRSTASTSTTDTFRYGKSPYTDTVMGHPGPQPEFNVRDYSYIVPYFSIID